MKITKTTKIVRSVMPGGSSPEWGSGAIISVSKPDWEDEMTLEEAAKKLHSMGGVLTNYPAEWGRKLRGETDA